MPSIDPGDGSITNPSPAEAPLSADDAVRFAVRLHQVEGPPGEGLAAQGIDDRGGRIGVGDAVGSKRMDES